MPEVEYKNIEPVGVNDVEIPPRLRRLNESAVDDLAESMASYGLMNPIWVSPVRDAAGRVIGHRLIAGRHRLAAAAKLGWRAIDGRIVECSETRARMMEIIENLHRAELTAEERAMQRAEYARLLAVDRGELTEDAEVSQLATLPLGGAGATGGVRQAARELGVSNDGLRRAIAIASIAPEVREAAREAGVTTQSGLLRVAAAPVAERIEAVEREAAGRPVAASQAERDFAAWITEHAESSELPMILTWLRECRGKIVAQEAKRLSA